MMGNAGGDERPSSNSSEEFVFPPDSGSVIPADMTAEMALQSTRVTWMQGQKKIKNADGEEEIKTYRCKYTDLRFNTIHNGKVRWGIKFRLIVPDTLSTFLPDQGQSGFAGQNPDPKYPLYLSFDYKSTEEAYPRHNHMKIAEEGIIVATTSMRGHVGAYKKGDPLHGQSDWKGPKEMMDFDCLLWCFMNGYILDELPLIDPARIGIGGASMGGITTLMYGRQTRIPSLTGHKIRVAAPGGCAPSMGDWFLPGLDPYERADWTALTTFGAIGLQGMCVQFASFKGYFLSQLEAWLEGDVNGSNPPPWPTNFESFLQYCEYRSSYDNYPDDFDNLSAKNFLDNVAYGLIRMGCQDSTIPRSPIYDFYEKLVLKASGDATGGSSTTLIDTAAAFMTDGVEAGDLVYNITDDSQGFVTAIDSETQITISGGMSSGRSNAAGDQYSISRNRFKMISTVGYHLGAKLQKDDDGFMAIPPEGSGYQDYLDLQDIQDHGYFPRCALNTSSIIAGWSFAKVKEYLVHYLVNKARYPDVPDLPVWLFMLGHETVAPLRSAGSVVPPIHRGRPPVRGIQPDKKSSRYFKDKYGSHPYKLSLAGTPPNLDWEVDLGDWTLRGCNYFDVEDLCKPKFIEESNNHDFTFFISEKLPNSVTVAGMPKLKIYCKESDGKKYSFTAIVGEMFERAGGQATGGSSTTLEDTAATFVTDGVIPGDWLYNETDNSRGTVTAVASETQLTISGGMSSGKTNDFDDLYSITAHNKFWPLTSQRCYRKTTPGTKYAHEFELDTMVHRFQKGNKICLILSPLSLPLNNYLMFGHNMQNYTLQMSNYSGRSSANLELPVIDMLSPPPDDWQIKDEDYVDYIWEEGSEYEEALGSPEPYLTETQGVNHFPSVPNNPDPAEDATDVDVVGHLNWTGSDPDAGDTVTYDVYFGTDPIPDADDLVSENQPGTTYLPAPLLTATDYYWKIVARDQHGCAMSGPIWHFTSETVVPGWISPDGHTDPGNAWIQEDQAYDVITGTAAGCPVAPSDPDDWVWTPWLELNFSSPKKCDRMQYLGWESATHCDQIEYYIYDALAGAVDHFAGTFNDSPSWNDVPFAQERFVTKAAFRFHVRRDAWDTVSPNLFEVQFFNIP